MNDDDELPTPDQYRLGILADIERLKKQSALLVRTLNMHDDEVQSLVELSIQFGLDTLPTGDAPPLLVAIMRSELARAMAHLKRGGRCARRMGLDVKHFSAALAQLRVGVDSLPKDLPKRRIP